MTKARILLALLVLGAALSIAPVAAHQAASPAGVPHQAAQETKAGGGNGQLVTIAAITAASAAGAGGVLLLGYLLRRRLGIDWHRSPTGIPQHEQEGAGAHEAAASEHHGASSH